MFSSRDFLYFVNRPPPATMPRSVSPSMSQLDFVYQRHHGLCFDRRQSVNANTTLSSPPIVDLDLGDEDDEVVFIEEVTKKPQQGQPPQTKQDGVNFEAPDANNGTNTPSSPAAARSERAVNLISESRVTVTATVSQVISESFPQAAVTAEKNTSSISNQQAVIDPTARLRNGEKHFFENHGNTTANNTNNMQRTCGPRIALSQQDSWSPMQTRSSSVPLPPSVSGSAHNTNSAKRLRLDIPTETQSSPIGGYDSAVGENMRTANMTERSKNPERESSRDYNQQSSPEFNNNTNLFLQDRQKEINIGCEQKQNNTAQQPRERREEGLHHTRVGEQGEDQHAIHSLGTTNRRYPNNNRFNGRDRGFYNRNRNSDWNYHRQNPGRGHSYYQRYPRQLTRRMDDNQPIRRASNHYHQNCVEPAFNQSCQNNMTSGLCNHSSPPQGTSTCGTSESTNFTSPKEARCSTITNNAIPVSQEQNSPNLLSTKKVWGLLTTCSLCKRAWKTRKEAQRHQKEAHQMKLCLVCFKPISTKECFHMEHFKKLHSVGDPNEKAACPICAAKFGYDGMYQHLSKMHLIDFEKETIQNKKEDKSAKKTEKNSKDENCRSPTGTNRHRSSVESQSRRSPAENSRPSNFYDRRRDTKNWQRGGTSSQASNQSRRHQSSSYTHHSHKSNNGVRVSNPKVNESYAVDVPEKPSSKLSSFGRDDVEHNLANAPRTLIKSFKIPKKKS